MEFIYETQKLKREEQEIEFLKNLEKEFEKEEIDSLNLQLEKKRIQRTLKGYVLQRKDFTTLLSNQWLNDELINYILTIFFFFFFLFFLKKNQ